ncbi:PKD repeat-containing protein, partial [Candidatus Methanophagaceae archaeon]
PTVTGNYLIGTLTIHCVNDSLEGCITPLEFIEGSDLYNITGFVIPTTWEDGTFTCPAQAQPPVSDPNGPYTGTEGVAMSFDGSGSSDPDGTIDSYAWDFGDGNTGTGVNPTHTYAQEGTYTVTLTVTDNDGATDTGTTTATIADTEPTADFTGTPTSGLEPLTVDFTDASTSYDGIVSWDWDFDNDGVIDSTVQNPSNTYSEGTYTVSLTVTEGDGDSDAETKVDYITVTIENQPPVSDPNGPYSGTEGVAMTFDGSGSDDPDGTIDTYAWEFGDGNTGTGMSPTHTYAQDGTYTVTLTVTDNDGATDTGTTTATIADTEQPTADFTGTPTSGLEPLTVDFTDASTSYDGVTAWDWDFDNDGVIDSTVQNPSHTYSEGTYTVSLTVTEGDGDSDTETKVDYITVSEALQPELCPDKYRWGSYNWDPFPLTFVGRQGVRFVNTGEGDAYTVTATVTCVPINVVASDDTVTLGDIPAGGSAWSSDTFEVRVDMTNPQDPNKGIVWRVEYDDAAGVHHVVDDVPIFCGQEINCP